MVAMHFPPRTLAASRLRQERATLTLMVYASSSAAGEGPISCRNNCLSLPVDEYELKIVHSLYSTLSFGITQRAS